MASASVAVEPAATPTKVTQQEFVIYFVNVGKGDCALIGLPGGKWAILDTGPDSGMAAIHGLMTVLGVKNLEAVFISHPHNDHIGGLDHVLSLAEAPVIYTGPSDFGKASDKLEEVAGSQGVPIERMEPGQAVELSGVTFTAIGPNGAFDEENDRSLVLMIEHGGTKALFPGDQQTAAETALLATKRDIGCTILKAGHHGQDDASSEAFLKAADPDFCVIPTGSDPSDAPAPAVLERLKAIGTQAYVVGQTGTLRYSAAEGTIKPVAPVSAPADLVIQAIDREAEFVDIANPTDRDADMTGWALLSDKGNQAFFFPAGFVLAAGETVRIHSGVKQSDASGGLFWTEKKIWKDKNADMAILLDPYGRIVSTK